MMKSAMQSSSEHFNEGIECCQNKSFKIILSKIVLLKRNKLHKVASISKVENHASIELKYALISKLENYDCELTQFCGLLNICTLMLHSSSGVVVTKRPFIPK